MTRIAGLFSALVLSCTVMTPCTAESTQIPPGSYLQTCEHPRVVGNELVAECAVADPVARTRVYRRTSLRLPCHNHDIANRDGHLVCVRY